MEENIIAGLLDQGVIGLVSIISLLAAWRMYRDKQAAEARLVAKAESWMDKYLKLAEAFKDAALKLKRKDTRPPGD